MAVVSPVPVFPQQIGRIGFHDLGISGLMESGGEIEEQPSLVVEDKIFVAVGKDVKESKSTLLWASKISGGKKVCILHVHKPAQMIPIMGTKFPANKLKEREVRAYRELEREKMDAMLNEYLFICIRAGVRAEKIDIEMDNIEKGIVELITQHGIKNLVMGAASDRHYSKKMTDLKSKKAIFVHQNAHISCHIWFVCKEHLIYTREGSLEGPVIQAATPSPLFSPISVAGQPEHLRHKSLERAQSHHIKLTNPIQDLFRRARSVSNSSPGRRVTLSFSEGTEGMPTPRSQLSADGIANEWEGNGISRRTPSEVSQLSTRSSSEEVVSISDLISMVRDEGNEETTVLPSLDKTDEELHDSSATANELIPEKAPKDELDDQLEQAMVEAETSRREAVEESLTRWKVEKQAMEAILKTKEFEGLCEKEMQERKEMEEMVAKEKQELEKMKAQRDQVTEELRISLNQKLVLENRIAESDAIVTELEDKIVSAVHLLINIKNERDELLIERDNAVKEAEKLRKAMEEAAASSRNLRFLSEFSFLEIEGATCSFDPKLKIGEGGYGTVYRAFLRHTQVAIKILDSHSLQGRSEFQQEVDVLSRVRHPNLVTLIGACPEAWTLVYEYLPNGSLEDRLACKDNSPPLSWQTRIRIAIEICSALIFLHSNKPHSIIHGDLKPANILLDANFVCKLGDFGLCGLIPHNENSTDASHKAEPKGTFAYMDPELLVTGELTPKSDVYSFGIILLQLLTGRPAKGIAKEVQYELDKGNLNALLDETAGDWPFVQAKQLAHVALWCCEMNRNNRLDLESEVLRVLDPIRASCGAFSSFQLGSNEHCRIPSYFMCPIFREIMEDPQVAADGFTYEAEALRGWLDSGHDTSPMTNLKLSHCNLIPNHALRSAIHEWQQQP